MEFLRLPLLCGSAALQTFSIRNFLKVASSGTQPSLPISKFLMNSSDCLLRAIHSLGAPVDGYRDLVATLIRDGRQKALVGLWLDALIQLPPLYSLTVMEETPGELTRNFDFQVDVLRELSRQVRAASLGQPTASEPGEMLFQTNRREKAEAVRSRIVTETREWLAAGERLGANPVVRELAAEIIGPLDELNLN
jgi:hypothetical protein